MRSFRQGRFTAARTIGEDVNPNAYVVNLVDCMLVLAVAFLVALISYWNIDLSVKDLSDSDLQKVSPESLSSDQLTSGDYYVEAGKVYRDPQTGQLYMIQGESDSASSDSASGSSSSSDTASGSASSAKNGSTSSSTASSASSSASAATSDDDIRNARAAGAD